MNFYKESITFLEKNEVREYIAIDIETTGLRAATDSILEIGAVHFRDDKVVDTFNMLINPQKPIPYYITKINGISNKMVKDAPSEDEVLREFTKFLYKASANGAIACAHNAKFDFGFLKNAFERAAIEFDLIYVDTLELARKKVLGLPNYKQGTLEEHFGVENKTSHRAFSDAKACGEIMWQLIRK